MTFWPEDGGARWLVELRGHSTFRRRRPPITLEAHLEGILGQERQWGDGGGIVCSHYFRGPLDTARGVGDALVLPGDAGMPVGLGHSPPPTSGTAVGAPENADAFQVEARPGGRCAFQLGLEMRKQRAGGAEPPTQRAEERSWQSCSVPGGRFTAGLFALAVLGVGCTMATLGERRLAPTGLAPQDAITAILEEQAEARQSTALEETVTGCIQDALRETHPAMRMVSADEFRRAAFPDLTPVETPPGTFSWEHLVTDIGLQERIAPLGLRYLIVVDVEEGRDPIHLHGGGAEGALVIGGDWKRWSRMRATILDITNHHVAGYVASDAVGKSAAGVFILYIFPVPYGKASFPRETACWKLGEGVAKFLAGESSSKP